MPPGCRGRWKGACWRPCRRHPRIARNCSARRRGCAGWSRRLGVGMYMAAARHRLRRVVFGRWVGRAAAVLILGCMVGGFFMLGTAVADSEQQAQVCRCLINTHGAERINWDNPALPTRSYEVIYEDSFVLDDGDTTYTALVPATVTVTVPAEVL